MLYQGDEDVPVGARVLDRAEPFQERRPGLQRLELASENGLSLDTWRAASHKLCSPGERWIGRLAHR